MIPKVDSVFAINQKLVSTFVFAKDDIRIQQPAISFSPFIRWQKIANGIPNYRQ